MKDKNNLSKYLPPFLFSQKKTPHGESSVEENEFSCLMKEILPDELGYIKDEIEEYEKQCFIVSSAKKLSYWEEMLGIDGSGKSYQERIQEIKSRLKGSGTASVHMIKDLAENYTGITVEVEELIDEFHFNVIFRGAYGEPPNMERLKKFIEDIKPAHLSFKFVCLYFLWGWIKDYEYRWFELNDAEKYTWGNLKVKLVKRNNEDIHLNWNQVKKFIWGTLTELKYSWDAL